MNEITDYISITEFAKKANVSRQAIYQRIDKDLTKYCKVIDNKKMLSLKALDLFISSVGQPIDKQQTRNCQEVEQAVDSGLQKNLIKTIELLQEQLEVKDKQLQQQLQAKDKQLEVKDKQLESLLELQRNNQVLLAQSQQKQISSTENSGADEDAQPTTKKHWWNRKK